MKSAQYTKARPVRPPTHEAGGRRDQQEAWTLKFAGGTGITSQAPPQVVQRLQRAAGNKAVATLLGPTGTRTAVQRATTGTTARQAKPTTSDQPPVPDTSRIDKLHSDPTVWSLVVAHAKKRHNDEVLPFYEAYAASRRRGGDGTNEELYTMATDGTRNFSAKDLQWVENGSTFWARPLSAFYGCMRTAATDFASEIWGELRTSEAAIRTLAEAGFRISEVKEFGFVVDKSVEPAFRQTKNLGKQIGRDFSRLFSSRGGRRTK